MRINIVLEDDVLKKCDDFAEQRGINRSDFIAFLVKRYEMSGGSAGKEKGIHYYSMEDMQAIIEGTQGKYKNADHFFNAMRVSTLAKVLNGEFQKRWQTKEEIESNGVIPKIVMNDKMAEFMAKNGKKSSEDAYQTGEYNESI